MLLPSSNLSFIASNKQTFSKRYRGQHQGLGTGMYRRMVIVREGVGLNGLND